MPRNWTTPSPSRPTTSPIDGCWMVLVDMSAMAQPPDPGSCAVRCGWRWNPPVLPASRVSLVGLGQEEEALPLSPARTFPTACLPTEYEDCTTLPSTPMPRADAVCLNNEPHDLYLVSHIPSIFHLLRCPLPPLSPILPKEDGCASTVADACSIPQAPLFSWVRRWRPG